MKNIAKVTLLLGSILALSGCETTPTFPTFPAMPTNLPDGIATHRFYYSHEETERFAIYTGEWRNSVPTGKGSITTSEGYMCNGVFVAPDSSGTAMATGEIYKGSSLVYRGLFSNYFGVGLGCRALGKGTQFLPPWKITTDFLFTGYFHNKADCTIEKDDGSSFSGKCAASKGWTIQDAGGPRVVPANDASADFFSLAAGEGVYTLPDGTQFRGEFNQGVTLSGLYRVTKPHEEPQLALYQNNKLIKTAPTPETIAKTGKDCGISGFLFTSGNCSGNSWSGDMNAYSPDGLRHLHVNFVKGVQAGDAELSRLDRNQHVLGKLSPPADGDISFTRGRLIVDGSLVYEGEINEVSKQRLAGKGICYVEGGPEVCEYLNGQRIDALFKTREENRKLLGALEAQKAETQRQAALQAQRQAAAAQQQQQSNQSEFQWGKFAALGSGALIGGVDKLSSEVQAKVLTGIVQDSMGGQQGMSHLNSAISSANASTSGAIANSSGSASSGSTNSRDQAAACGTQYNGPNSDPQFDSFCKQAAFDACLHRVTQQTTYDQEGRAACKTLKGLLDATGSEKAYSCSYCPYPY